MLECEEIPDTAWQQALLPKGAGLGLLDLVKMAPFMAHASILEATVRLAEMDPIHFGEFSDPDHWEIIKDTQVYKNFNCALAAVKKIPVDDIRFAQLQQQFATNVINPEILDAFLKSASVPNTAKAIVRSTVNSPLAKQFLTAIPTEDGLKLSSVEMRISLCLLLGIPLAMKSENCICKNDKPLTMYHALSCKSHNHLILRHDSVKEVLGEMCKAAQLSYRLEPQQALSGNKLRPDILIHFGKDGYDVAFDLTIDNPVRNQESLATSLKDDQAFLKQQAGVKIKKYQQECRKNGASFTPIVLSAFGGILDDSYDSGIKFLIRKMNNKHFNSPNWAAPDKKTYWLQRLIITLWAGNVKQMSNSLMKKPLIRC